MDDVDSGHPLSVLHIDSPPSIGLEQLKWPPFAEKIRELTTTGRSSNKNYCLVDGLLHYRKGTGLRLCAPPALRMDIFRACHDDLLSGHLGRNRTLRRIAQRFFWPRMVHSVERYVRQCPGIFGMHRGRTAV